MAQSYFATRITENISKTPEGYMLCTAVPISRTGWQDYLGRELVTDVSLEPTKIYKVYRSEAEVFAPAALASFEGKSVCDGHPEFLTANNDGAYSRGHGQNIRRGEGEDSQAAVCDLIIKDAVLISKVENGLRDISCGYGCEYKRQEDGTFLQTNIRGNHIAVVSNGRAGDRIAIKDELPQQIVKGARPTMKFINRILAEGFKAWAKDAKPEEVAEAMKEMREGAKDDDRGGWDHTSGNGYRGGRDHDAAEAIEKAKAEKAAKDAEAAAAAAKPIPEAEHVTALKQLSATIADVLKRVEALEKGEAAEATEATSLDALETELTGTDCQAVKDAEAKAAAEKATKDAEAAAAKVIEPEKKGADAEPEKKDDANAADTNAAVLAGIRVMKPVIAAIADPIARKQATDSLTAAFRAQVSAKATDKAGTTYGKLGTAKKAADAQAQTQADKDREYGRQLKEKRHRQM